MNKQPVRGVEVESLPEEAIAEYLHHHPDFFERHATLLTRLKIPHGRGPSTISLVERQVLVLREKNEKLETHLQDLISVARANDALANKIHRLSCRLIRARNASAVVDTLESSLREDFGASEWLMLLAPSAQSASATPTRSRSTTRAASRFQRTAADPTTTPPHSPLTTPAPLTRIARP